MGFYLYFTVIAFITFSFTMANNIPKTMKAVGFYKYLPISDVNSLVDLRIDVPTPQKTQYLVKVKATAVNPVDVKVRNLRLVAEPQPKILGYDGAGVVVSKGEDANKFSIGDEVLFSGELAKNGCNAEYVALDEILVGRKPQNLTMEQAAAMPLTAVTAYEALYDRLQLSEKDKGKTLLIINSAGGVGSVASQLAKNLGMKVIGTASRSESKDFSVRFGADIVLNHTQDLIPQLENIGLNGKVDYILINFDPYPYWDTAVKAIKPQGRICLLVDSSHPVDIKGLKDKSITLVYEMMNTRIKYQTEDKYRLHDILTIVSKMLESGELKTTLTKTISPINAANLREAHRLMEEKTMIGKLVLSGF